MTVGLLIPLDKIRPNPEQPRKYFGEIELEGLAQSIKAVGVINSISVVEDGLDGYFIIDGERRWRASKMAGKSDIPAVVKDKDSEKGLLAAIANIQRSDLTPIEEANAYKVLIDKGFSKLKISQKTGVSYPTIANRLKLIEFDEEIQVLFERGLLPIGEKVINALNTVEDNENRVKLAKKLARPGIKISSIEIACQKLNASLRAAPVEYANPALQFSTKLAGEINLPEWDILYQLNKVPKWPVIVDAAIEICDRCALRSQASSVTCSDCPAVQILAVLINRSNVDHGIR